jgi:K+-sensing histidine kinase KdpD
MFRRVLDNVLSNAITSSPNKSKVVISADYLANGSFRIQITDLGEGVPDTLQQIFEKYEVVTSMQNVSQVGLGMAFLQNGN